MIQGLYAAATGMLAVEQRQAVIANNIANASTAGFKRQRVVDKGFYQVLFQRMRRPAWADSIRGPGGGLQVTETFTDLSRGAIRTTGDPLTVALDGPGYIAVDTPAGERFTRSGQFSVNADGQLTTEDGYGVQGAGGGGIEASGGPIQINEEGTVLVAGTPAGRIRIVEFEDPHLLTREGHNLYRASDEALGRSAPATETRVAPESLEMANVQLPYEMIEMMLALRIYSANQRVINAIDETAARLIQDVGMPV